MNIKGSSKTRLNQCVGRYHSEHPHLDVEKQQLIMTNGHVFVILPVTTSEGETSGPVPVAAIMPLFKKVKLHETRPILHCADEVVLTSVAGVKTIYPRHTDRKFPKWESVIVRDERLRTITVNARLLLDVQEAMDCEFLDVYVGADDKPIVVAPAGRHKEGYGLVMPSRSDSKTFPTPELVK